MSAIENMMRMVLSSLDIDVEGMKTEVTSRIVAFEANIATLNATLIDHQKSLERIEQHLIVVRGALNVAPKPLFQIVEAERDD